jgi:hypothetical protein
MFPLIEAVNRLDASLKAKTLRVLVGILKTSPPLSLVAESVCAEACARALGTAGPTRCGRTMHAGGNHRRHDDAHGAGRACVLARRRGAHTCSTDGCAARQTLSPKPSPRWSACRCIAARSSTSCPACSSCWPSRTRPAWTWSRTSPRSCSTSSRLWGELPRLPSDVGPCAGHGTVRARRRYARAPVRAPPRPRRQRWSRRLARRGLRRAGRRRHLRLCAHQHRSDQDWHGPPRHHRRSGEAVPRLRALVRAKGVWCAQGKCSARTARTATARRAGWPAPTAASTFARAPCRPVRAGEG